MEAKHLEELLLQVQRGQLGVRGALDRLRILPFEDLGFAKIDHHRALRKGFPEVVYAPGKSLEQLAQIAQRMAETSSRVLITRADPETYARIREVLPEAQYNELARAIVLKRGNQAPPVPGVLIVAAGTADLPVAEEAAVTAELMGNEVERIWDVGIAGVHRLLEHLPLLQKARVVVAVAGMEGALPSLVGGLVAAPVIAVPTSVGYGASFQGLAALLAMLNSCSPGIAVVNIDNGFGAGYMAGIINLSAGGPLRE
ncbi:MAG: nickel pincer cofactor biosynthesis protein LarB [Chloroflexi bacterium]|nr:nickel pincer cofactor biosynthesis protein LarB [Chloroflexota bacterium]